MQELARYVRIAGIAIGIFFVVSLAWVVLIGPTVFLLLRPR